MSNLQKRLLILFCVGVFLSGVGAGVVFTEFGGLAYGGKQVVGATDMRTENFDVTFETGEEKYSIVGNYWFGSNKVQVDNSVPENTVRFSTTYNAECIEPFVYADEEEKRIIFSYAWRGESDELPLIMEAKDVFLQNLKEGKLVTFERPEITKVTILVNEKTMDNVSAY